MYAKWSDVFEAGTGKSHEKNGIGEKPSDCILQLGKDVQKILGTVLRCKQNAI